MLENLYQVQLRELLSLRIFNQVLLILEIFVIELLEPFENDPPPPYSPSEASQPSLSVENPSTAPSAPTASDVGFYSAEGGQTAYSSREYQPMDPSTPQTYRYNYGSVEPPSTTGDVYQTHEQNQSLLSASQQREQAHQQRTIAQQQREQAQQQRNIAQQQREQAYQQRNQRAQLGAQGNSFHTMGDRLREQGTHLRSQLGTSYIHLLFVLCRTIILNSAQLIAGLGDQIRNSLNGQKPQYTRVDQEDGGVSSSTSESQALTGRRRRIPFKRILCHLLLVCFIVGFVLFLTVGRKHHEDSEDEPELPDQPLPDRPLPDHPSPVPPIPSETPSNPPSNPPGDSPKHPHKPKQPENPNAPGHLPDGSSCGADCTVASYKWPIDDYLRSFSFIQSGILNSGRTYIKRSRSAGPGNLYVSLELTAIKLSDITLIYTPSRSSSGTIATLSTPRAISPFSRIVANITIELPLDTMDSFQEFNFIAQNIDVAFEETDDSNTFNISRLEVRTTNADIVLSPLLTADAGLEIATRNGDISGIARSKGKVDISSTNGDIDLDMVGDTAIVYTTNAEITGEYVCASKCEFQTTSGDLVLRKVQTNSLLLDNKNGKIDVRNISSVMNIVSSGKNGPTSLQVSDVKPGALIVLSTTNDKVDLTMVSA